MKAQQRQILDLLVQHGVLTPGSPRRIPPNFGIGAIEGMNLHEGMKRLFAVQKTPVGDVHWGSGSRGTSFTDPALRKAIHGSTIIDFETRGLDPWTDPIWSAARLSPVEKQTMGEAMIANFLGKDASGTRIDYDYIFRHQFGFKEFRPFVGTEAEKIEKATQHILDNMGTFIRPEVYQSGPEALETSTILKNFVKDLPEDLKRTIKSPTDAVRLYFDPQANPLNSGVAFLHGEGGTTSRAVSDILRIAGVDPSKVDTQNIARNLLDKMHTGKAMNLKDWLTSTFDAASQGSRTIIAHNLQFESRFAAARIDDQFWKQQVEGRLHAYSKVSAEVEGYGRHRIYTTSTALTSAKHRAAREWTFDAWSNVFNEWTGHLKEDTKRLKILDSLDLGRAVFGMAQTAQNRDKLHMWQNTHSYFGTSMQAYSDALAEYVEKTEGVSLPDYLKKEAHRGPHDVILQESYIHDLTEIGEALKQGKHDQLSHRHMSILQNMGRINTDTEKRFDALRKQILSDTEAYLNNGFYDLSEYARDPKTGRLTVPETKVPMFVEDSKTGKMALHYVPQNKYNRRKRARLDELVEYHISALDDFYKRNIDKSRLDELRGLTLGLEREYKLARHSGKIPAVTNVIRELQKVDIHDWDKKLTSDPVKSLIVHTETKSVETGLAKQMSHLGKVGLLSIGGIGGALLMKLGMGSEADRYMASMENQHYKTKQGFWDAVSIPASLGVTAYGGYMFAKNLGPVETSRLSGMVTDIQKVGTKNLGSHLFPMAAAAAALSGAMYVATSNVEDVVDADPSGGHPFKVGAAAISLAGTAALTYSLKYGSPNMDGIETVKTQDRFVDRLAKMALPEQLSNSDSKAMDNISHIVKNAGRTFDATNHALNPSSVVDPTLTAARPGIAKAGFKEMTTAFGRWKVPAFIMAGVAAAFAVDTLAAPEERAIPAERIADEYAKKEAIGEYGFSKEMHDFYTPFGSRYNPMKATAEAFTGFLRMRRQVDPLMATPALLARMVPGGTGIWAGQMAEQARWMEALAPRPAKPRFTSSMTHWDARANARIPQPEAMAMSHIRQAKSYKMPFTYPQHGILTDMPVPETGDPLNVMSHHARPIETLNSGAKVHEPTELKGKSPHRARLLAEAHLNRMEDANIIRSENAARTAIVSRLSDHSESIPARSDTGIISTIPLPKAKSRDIMGKARGMDHVLAADMTKTRHNPNLFGAGRPSGPRPRRRNSAYLAGVA